MAGRDAVRTETAAVRSALNNMSAVIRPTCMDDLVDQQQGNRRSGRLPRRVLAGVGMLLGEAGGLTMPVFDLTL